MPPKKIKLYDALDNVYENDFEYLRHEKMRLTENEWKMQDTVNYCWKVNYNVVREQNELKVQVFVDFNSRYVFEDKVDMFITVKVAEGRIKKEFELEKRSGQKFEVDLTQLGNPHIKNKYIRVNCTIGLSKKNYNAEDIGSEAIFTDRDRAHDVVLFVKNRKFYVLKQYLSTWSKFFNTLFFGESAEKDRKEFEIEDVDADELDDLMYIIHPSLIINIDEDNVLDILKLAGRFEMPSVIAMCGTYLSDFHNAPKISLMQRLELSDKHNISHLQIAVSNKIHVKNGDDLKAFLDENRDRIKNLSEGTVKNLI